MNFETYSCTEDTQKVKWHSESVTRRFYRAGLANMQP